jgi:hypothetical protein
MQLLPIITVAAIALVLILVLVWRVRGGGGARAVQLAQLGFVPCDAEEQAIIQERVAWLESNPYDDCRLQELQRASLEGETVYHYLKSRRRSGNDPLASEEILLPLHRPSEEGLLLFIKPGTVGAGLATTLLQAVTSGKLDAQPPGMQQIAIPPELEESNLFGALGPGGIALDELIDRSTLEILQVAGDCGAIMVLCRGTWCALVAPRSSMRLKLQETWELVQRLV